MQRMGFAIRVKPECMDDYVRVHADVWPDVLETIRACNIRNYSIHLFEPDCLMFAYYEYHGEDHATDMEKMAADRKTQEWWALCKPMMDTLDGRGPDEFWAGMTEVFFAP